MRVAIIFMLAALAAAPAQTASAQAYPVRPIRLIIAVPPGGAADLPHLVGEMFKAATGSPIVHVPYKGSGPGVIDLAAGHVQLGFDSLPSIFPHVQSGRVKLLATVGKSRSSLYPELPSLGEAGYPQVDGKVWYGISGPAGIPKPVVSRISTELRKILDMADVKQRFGQQAADATYLSPDEFLAFMKAEWAKWGPVVKATGAKAD